MSPEDRAKAVVEHFAASLPPAIRPQLENVIARAITRAVHQELALLERSARSVRKARTARASQREVTIRPPFIGISIGQKLSG